MPPGWPEKGAQAAFVLLASSLGYGITCSFVDDKISMLTLLYHWITTSFHTLIIHSRLRSLLRHSTLPLRFPLNLQLRQQLAANYSVAADCFKIWTHNATIGSSHRMRRAFFELGFYGMQVADPSNFLCSNDGWIELTCFVLLLQHFFLTTPIAVLMPKYPPRHWICILLLRR